MRAVSSAGEHLPYTQRVIRSNRIPPTGRREGRTAGLGPRAERCRRSRGRSSAGLERLPVTQEVAGSSPVDPVKR